MVTIKFEVTEEEKKRLDIAKARSEHDSWKDFFLGLIEDDNDD